MTEFTIALAGKRISIRTEYPQVKKYCRNYLSDGPADLCVEVSDRDIEFERSKSAREDLVEGREVYEYPEAYLATLSVYRKIAEKMLNHDTVLFHGSAVCVDGQGYLFTAKSGTGKSTHTRLWRERFGDRLITVNDDKPLLRVTEDCVWVCGTPWDGKHRISTNIMVPLRGICVLRRAEDNHIEPITALQALPIMLQQSYRPADSAGMAKLLKLVERISKLTGLYALECNMLPEAAKVAYEGMSGKEE